MALTYKPKIRNGIKQGSSSADKNFVAWLLVSPNVRGGFLTRVETGVAELSPFISEAWHFASAKEAETAAQRALGIRYENCACAVFPASSLVAPRAS